MHRSKRSAGAPDNRPSGKGFNPSYLFCASVASVRVTNPWMHAMVGTLGLAATFFWWLHLCNLHSMVSLCSIADALLSLS